MSENKKAPAPTGASANTKVIVSSIKAILTWVQIFYNGNEVITFG
ncbi:hypothetical protein [Streptococcus ruminicola]|nr:hypothetical protein [Streptococcus ruminicola]